MHISVVGVSHCTDDWPRFRRYTSNLALVYSSGHQQNPINWLYCVGTCFWGVYWQRAQLLSHTPSLYTWLQHTAGLLACAVCRCSITAQDTSCCLMQYRVTRHPIIYNGRWNDAIDAAGQTEYDAMRIYMMGSVMVTFKDWAKSEHLYSALHGTNHSKALRHGSHSF